MAPMSVYVGGLSEDTQKEDLEKEFSRFGSIARIWVAQNPPGFAFVDFENDDDANEAIKEMNGAVINGSQISVDVSRGGSKRGGGRGGFRGGRGGRDGGGYGGGRDFDSGFRRGGSRGGGGYSRGRDSDFDGGFRRGGRGDGRGFSRGGPRYGGAGYDGGSGYRSRSPGQSYGEQW